MHSKIMLFVLLCLLTQNAFAQNQRRSLQALYIGEQAENRLKSTSPTDSRDFQAAVFRQPFTGAAAVGMNTGTTAIRHAPEASNALRIDGKLNEDSWQTAQIATDFTQREPNEGALATEATEVRVLYDKKYLYIGFRCFDREPEKIVATEMRNDGDLDNDDHVRVVIDTYLDRRNGFVFETTPPGARSDAKVTDEGRNVNNDWDIVWDVNASVTASGWEAEMRIPLNQLRYPENDENSKWGINFSRVIRRKREDTYWSPIRLDYGFGSRAFYKISRAGDLAGLRNMPHSSRFEIKPYSITGMQRDATVAPVDKDKIVDAGFDMKYALSENLIADVTFNTDFAQVEADQERVNLTRFSLFFPEKREFFLEGAGMFRVGGSSGGGGRGNSGDQLFYSRRIGLSDGNEVPILAGSKLTGNVAGFEVGLLNVVTDDFFAIDEEDTASAPRTNYAALRMTKPVFSNSSIGVLALSKDAFGQNRADTDFETFHRTLAVDGNVSLGRRTLNTWLARTVTAGNPVN